ncbi:MAG: oligosaccharide flippase family protein, partial [Pleurocapsa sp. SU_196_0]|nr:oligosaccharide flippase family protein [Pleurocapsa sp. SU_196_0]
AMGGYAAVQILRLASSLIMTRLLAPELFGMMAVTISITIVVSLLSDVGIRQAVVQSTRGDSPEMLRTAFTIQVVRGVVIWLVCILVALVLDQLRRRGFFAPGAVYASPDLMIVVIALVGAHPILVSLSMMIFLRGLGEFLTRGGDISGFPEFLEPIGHGLILGVPVPLILFGLAALAWHILLSHTRHGFAVRMIGSNLPAARYSGIHTARTLTLLYTLSGVMAALAGILMLTRFNSVRVGHGEALLLVTVLACFLGGVDRSAASARCFPSSSRWSSCSSPTSPACLPTFNRTH